MLPIIPEWEEKEKKSKKKNCHNFLNESLWKACPSKSKVIKEKKSKYYMIIYNVKPRKGYACGHLEKEALQVIVDI